MSETSCPGFLLGRHTVLPVFFGTARWTCPDGGWLFYVDFFWSFTKTVRLVWFYCYFGIVHVRFWIYVLMLIRSMSTLQETNISPKNGILKMIFLFPRWDMLIPWRVYLSELIIIEDIVVGQSAESWARLICAAGPVPRTSFQGLR